MNAETKPLDSDEAIPRDPFLAFVIDEGSESVLREITESLLLPEDTVRRGTIQEARNYLEHMRSPRLLIVDVQGLPDPLEQITQLADVCELGTKLIAIGEHNDVSLYRDLLSMGATDYLVKPLEKDSLLRAMSALDETGMGMAALGRTGKMISFIGSRGGVGVTTLAANCGWTIAGNGTRRAALVDLDTHFGNLALILGAEAREGLAGALEQPDRIDSLFLDRVMSQASDRLFVIGGEENLSHAFNGGAEGAIDTLVGDLRGKFHFVIVDLPRCATLTSQRALQLGGTTVVVSDLSLSGMRDTARILKLVRESNPGSRLILVVNKIGENPKAEIPIAEFEKGVGRKVNFKINFEVNAVVRAANLGESLMDTRSTTARSIEELAEALTGTPARAPQKKSLFRIGKG